MNDELEKGMIKCSLSLPFIFNPEGEYEVKIGKTKVHFSNEIREYPGITTLMVPNSIIGIHPAYGGFSMIRLKFSLEKPLNEEYSINDLMNFIIFALNEIQYRYLNKSKGYVWVAIIPEHIRGMSLNYENQKIGMRRKDIWRKIPPINEINNDEIKTYLETVDRISQEFVYLIDAKKHYTNSEYHLMYIALAVSLEIMIDKVIKKVTKESHKKILAKGNKPNQIYFIFDEYRNWPKEDIEKLIQVIVNRNTSVHEGLKVFSPEVALDHILITEKAVIDIDSSF